MEAAGHQHDHLRIDIGYRRPVRLARCLAVLAEEVPAACAPDLLGHPVADRERWIEPLDTGDARRLMAVLAAFVDTRLDHAEARAKALDEIDGRIFGVGHRADGRDRIEDALERGRLEGDDGDLGVDRASDLVDLPIAHGADLAELLGQDQVRPGVLQGSLVEGVQRRAAVNRVADEPVDISAPARTVVEDAARHDGLADDLRRPVALVGYADELIAEPKGADDLGGGRKEGDDAHQAPSVGRGPIWAQIDDRIGTLSGKQLPAHRGTWRSSATPLVRGFREAIKPTV